MQDHVPASYATAQKSLLSFLPWAAS